MNDRIIEFDSLIEGFLIKRYKRFLADIQLDTGEIVLSSSPKRKLPYTWEQVRAIDKNNQEVWVGINTLFANKLIKKVIENKLLREKIGDIEKIKSEVPYGKNLLTPKSSNPDNRNIYVEVKNTTWIKENVALFPDTETKRGQKHLVELKELIPESKSVLIPCMTRKDADYFAPGDEADPSLSAGMILIPCCFEFHLDHVSWNGIKSLKLDYN